MGWGSTGSMPSSLHESKYTSMGIRKLPLYPFNVSCLSICNEHRSDELLSPQARLRDGLGGPLRSPVEERANRRRRTLCRCPRAHPRLISLPHRGISFNSTVSLNKSKLYLCYCDGIGCNASTKTAMKLVTLGFQVRELIGGLEWRQRDGHATHGDQGQAQTGVKCPC